MKPATRKLDARPQQVRLILERERSRAYTRIRELREEQEQNATPSPADELDEARSLAQIETDASLIELAEDRLKAIDVALSRLERNRYGLCEGCGNEIPVVRLRALPFAIYCVRCRQKYEVTRSGEGFIDNASSKCWRTSKEMDKSLETQDALVEPEDQLCVHDKQPFGPELGEFEQLPPVATARRRGRIKQHEH